MRSELKIFMCVGIFAITGQSYANNEVLPTLTPAQVQEAKKAGAELGAGAVYGRKKINPDGTLSSEKSGNPNPVSDPSSKGMVNDLFGVDVIAPAGSTASKGEIGAIGSLKSKISFSCDKLSKSPQYVQGVAILADACLEDSQHITGFSFYVCLKSQTGQDCKETDWVKHTVAETGLAVISPSVQISLSCNDESRACEGFLRTKENLRSSDMNSANSAAMTKAYTQEQGSVYKSLTGQYAAVQTEARQQAGTLKSCYNTSQTGLASGGNISTCDGTKTTEGLIGAGNTVKICKSSSECIETASKQLNWGFECKRQIPTTSYTCSWETPSKDCVVTRVPSATPHTCVKTITTVKTTTIIRDSGGNPIDQQVTTTSSASGCETWEALQ